jgi:hypothetical protein
LSRMASYCSTACGTAAAQQRQRRSDGRATAGGAQVDDSQSDGFEAPQAAHTIGRCAPIKRSLPGCARSAATSCHSCRGRSRAARLNGRAALNCPLPRPQA